jgi:hypothetical protein
MTGDEVRVGGFDLVWRDGPFQHTPNSVYSSMLGGCRRTVVVSVRIRITHHTTVAVACRR